MIAREKTLVVDVDGTLCPIKTIDQDYASLPVDEAMKARLVALRAEGWRIIISSARGMRSFDGNQGEILKHVFPILRDWLERHGVPYDEIWMAKPWPGTDGFYIDDRTVRPREFLNYTLQELAVICDRDRNI